MEVFFILAKNGKVKSDRLLKSKK